MYHYLGHIPRGIPQAGRIYYLQNTEYGFLLIMLIENVMKIWLLSPL